MNLFQIKPEYYPEYKIDDIIDINGQSLSGHGLRICKILNKKPKLYQDVLDFINLKGSISEKRIEELSNLHIEDIPLNNIAKELILEKLRREIDVDLPSRFNSVFLSTKKEIHKWVSNILDDSKNKPIYELEILEQIKRYDGDENFWQIYKDWSYIAKEYWTKPRTIGVRHLYETVFQGKLKVKSIFKDYAAYKKIAFTV